MSERIKSIHFMPEDYPLQGSKTIAYIHFEDPTNPDGEGTILYAGSDGDLEYGHEFIFEAAKVLGDVDEDAKPLGGGHLDATTLAKTRDSHSYGAVDQRVLEDLEDELMELLS